MIKDSVNNKLPPRGMVSFKSSAKVIDSLVYGGTFGIGIMLFISILAFFSIASEGFSSLRELLETIIFSLIMIVGIGFPSGLITGLIYYFIHGSQYSVKITSGDIKIQRGWLTSVILNDNILDYRIDRIPMHKRVNLLFRGVGLPYARTFVTLKLEEKVPLALFGSNWLYKDGWLKIDVDDPELFIQKILPLKLKTGNSKKEVYFSSDIMAGKIPDNEFVTSHNPKNMVKRTILILSFMGMVFLSFPTVISIIIIIIDFNILIILLFYAFFGFPLVLIILIFLIITPILWIKDTKKKLPVYNYKVKVEDNKIFVHWPMVYSYEFNISQIRSLSKGKSQTKKFLLDFSRDRPFALGDVYSEKSILIEFKNPVDLKYKKVRTINLDVDDEERFIKLVKPLLSSG